MRAPGDLVTVADERVHLEIGEAVEVGADRRHLCLEDGMERMGIFRRRHDRRDRDEMKTVLIAEILPLELPDPVPEDVGGADRLREETE